eukprot:1585-Heterococcus_DN1.PRE.2
MASVQAMLFTLAACKTSALPRHCNTAYTHCFDGLRLLPAVRKCLCSTVLAAAAAAAVAALL